MDALTEKEAATVKSVRKTYLTGSSAVQAEINKLIVGEQNLMAKHPAVASFVLVAIGAAGAMLFRAIF